MPFVSKAQKRKWQSLLEDKKINQEQYEKMARGTPKDLPEYGGKRPVVARVHRHKK